jgi:RNA polymerase sigma factor (sigma-70 family)
MGRAENGQAVENRRRNDAGEPATSAWRRRELRHADDQSLLIWAREGDREAFDALYQRHHRELGRYARGLSRRLLQRDVGEDMVAEAIRKTLLAIHNGNGPTDSFLMYAYASVRAVIYTYARRHQDESLDAVAEAGVESADDALDGIAARQAFRTLPHRWQQVLWATKVAGMSACELADMLGITANSAAVLCSRAREGLRIAYVRTQLPDTTDRRCDAVLNALARRRVVPVSETHARLIRQHTSVCQRCRTAAHSLEQQSVLPWLGNGLLVQPTIELAG